MASVLAGDPDEIRTPQDRLQVVTRVLLRLQCAISCARDHTVPTRDQISEGIDQPVSDSDAFLCGARPDQLGNGVTRSLRGEILGPTERSV